MHSDFNFNSFSYYQNNNQLVSRFTNPLLRFLKKLYEPFSQKVGYVCTFENENNNNSKKISILI